MEPIFYRFCSGLPQFKHKGIHMKLKVSTQTEALDNFGGSSYIAKSGIYDVTIKFASVDVTKNGAESVNFNLDYNGNSQTIYGPFIQNTDGNVNEIGAKLINSLAVILGMTEDDEYVIEEEEHTVGKDNKVQTFNVITNFSDQPIKIHLQEEYSINPKNNEIQKRMVIKNFFREDTASAKEVVSGKDIGKQFELIQEKYASNITYKDDLTPEDVQKWRDSKKDNKPAPKAKPAANKPANSLFK